MAMSMRTISGEGTKKSDPLHKKSGERNNVGTWLRSNVVFGILGGGDE